MNNEKSIALDYKTSFAKTEAKFWDSCGDWWVFWGEEIFS